MRDHGRLTDLISAEASTTATLDNESDRCNRDHARGYAKDESYGLPDAEMPHLEQANIL